MAGKPLLLTLLGVMACAFGAYWGRSILAARAREQPQNSALAPRPPRLEHIGIGFATDFLDTLGIGSFAVTTALFRWRKLVDDRLIPGTLNVGHAAATFAEAFIFIAIVEVDATTLVAMIAGSVAGALAGARVVAAWPRRRIQLGMGLALLLAALLMLSSLLRIGPAGGEALGLSGPLLLVGVAGNFVLGMLMMLGVGLFAPCMMLVYLLGMSPRVAFPIMMGSCAFLMPPASVIFIRRGSYAVRPALGLALGGVPGVLLAASIFKSLPLQAVRLLVVVVVVITAIGLLRAGLRRS